MAWYTDEQYEMIRDSREKKSVAASAFKQRTHCGKGGSVKFPSDTLSKKELNAMNGEIKSYRMNDPMSWDEFKEMPDDLRVDYIKALRNKFNVPDKEIAEMFGIDAPVLINWFKCMGVRKPKSTNESDTWNKEGWFAWRTGASSEAVEASETPIVEQTPMVYRPMAWDDFTKLSNDRKADYIRYLRDKFNTPANAIAEMFGIHASHLYREILSPLKLSSGRTAKRAWDKAGFEAWKNASNEEAAVNESTGKSTNEDVVDQLMDIITEAAVTVAKEVCPEVLEDSAVETTIEERVKSAGPIAFVGNPIPVIPKDGTMSFEGNRAEDILTTLKTLLGCARVNMTISWEVVGYDVG